MNLFFAKLYPTSLKDAMQKLCLKTVSLAITKLHEKIQTKDIQFAENTQDKKLGGEVYNGSTSLNSKFCLNCKFHKDTTFKKTHNIWQCRNIDFCFRCDKKHLAMGPHCPHKNLQLFDFNKFLQQRRTQSTVSPSEGKPSHKTKQKSEQRSSANNVTIDKLNSSLEQLTNVISKFGLNDQKDNEVKHISKNDIIIDT